MATTSKRSAKTAKTAVVKTAKTAAAKPRQRATRKTREPTSKPGHPGLLTPELQDEIVRHLELGNYLNTVCRFVGVGESTVYEWLARGRQEAARLAKGDEPDPDEARYFEFLVRIDRADVNVEVSAERVLVGLLGAVRTDAQGQPVLDGKGKPVLRDDDVRRRTAVDLLERRYRGHWSRGERQDITVRGHTRIDLTIEQQEERTRAIVAGLVETSAVAALEAQRALSEGGQVDDD